MTTNTGMFITLGESTLSIPPLQSSSGDAAYAGSTAVLIDGRPGTQCPITWCSGIASNTDYVEVVFRILPVPTVATECRVFALLGLRNIAVGTRIRLYGGNSAVPNVILANVNAVALPGGKVGVWVTFAEGSGYTYQYYGWRIFNDVAGVPYIAPSSTVYVGEVFVDACEEWPVATFSQKLVDPSKLNRSSGNQPWAIMRYPYRQYDIGIVQQRYGAAFLDEARNLQKLEYAMAQARYVAIIPRPRDRGNPSVDNENANQQGMLARVSDIGQISGDAVKDRWPLTLQFEECL